MIDGTRSIDELIISCQISCPINAIIDATREAKKGSVVDGQTRLIAHSSNRTRGGIACVQV